MTSPFSRRFTPLAAAAVLLLAAAAVARAEPCLECHDRDEVGAGDRSVHPPFADDDCEACHEPHGDEERLLLVAEGTALCTECHDVGDDDFRRAHHGVVGDRVPCTSCHDPHRSTEPRLLLPDRHRPLAYGLCEACHRFDGRLTRPVPGLCLGCHRGEEFSRAIAHAPIRSGECLACHDPHASRESALLRRRYTPGRAITGEGDVALCLGCHDRRAFFDEATDRTLFRNGEENYHRLHLVRPREAGRATGSGSLSCRNCHETHTSEGARLVRRELDCDGVPCLRLDYRREGTGGRCLSGCHAPRSYAFVGPGAARVTPAAAPPPEPRGSRGSSRASVPQPSDLERSMDRRCVGCHAEDVKGFAAGARVHAPVRAGACTSCHLDHGPENRLILLGRLDRVCGRCHPLAEPGLRAAHHGTTLEESRCTECHDPHGGSAPGLLLPELHPPFEEGDCAACHGKIAATWRIEGRGDACRDCHEEGGEERPHSAIAAQGCRGCHRPHASRDPGLLRDRGAELCFPCHDRNRFSGVTMHAPAEEGDCAACHPPHGSVEPRLLARAYPLDRFVPYEEEAYGLCWECHDASLTDPEDTDGGGFTAGGRNLHALHVRDRVSINEIGRRVLPGISCRNCHDPHATADPRLLRRSLDCDGVPCLQLEFRKAGAGGRCSGGCHDVKTYGTE